MITRTFTRHAERGFSMIELMVVVAIVGILAMIAIPNYSAYVQRSRIVDATSRLGDFRVRMEQFFLDNRSYTNAAGKCGNPDPVLVGSSAFDIKCVAADARNYVVTATGLAGMNMQAFSYSIDQSGVKTTLGVPAGWVKTAGCWVVRSDGACV